MMEPGLQKYVLRTIWKLGSCTETTLKKKLIMTNIRNVRSALQALEKRKWIVSCTLESGTYWVLTPQGRMNL